MLHKKYMGNFYQARIPLFKGLLSAFCPNACGICKASSRYVICNSIMYTTVIQKKLTILSTPRYYSNVEYFIVLKPVSISK